jgi:hypothetical protein
MKKTKGKCYSKVNKGQRKESDFYQTPYSMTKQLLEVEKFKEPILEPACGQGAIIKELIKNNYKAIKGFDLSFDQSFDFLGSCTKFPSSITNPPFSLANEFIEKCYEVCTDKFALLMPLVYLHGQKRYEQGLFRGLTKVYVFTRMPMLTSEVRADGKYNTGMQVYAWFIFDQSINQNITNPIISWIDNSMYVLRKGE